jgi:hypothetical protein
MGPGFNTCSFSPENAGVQQERYIVGNRSIATFHKNYADLAGTPASHREIGQGRHFLETRIAAERIIII